MLIIGAGGHAVEVLDVFEKNNNPDCLHFYDDISHDLPELLFGKYSIVRSIEEARKLFITDNRFILGIGSPAHRKNLTSRFKAIGGVLTSIISTTAMVGNHDVNLEPGINIMHGVTITNEINIGEGTLINANVCIHHGSSVGKFCEISPGCHLNGNVSIGAECSIGTGAILIPKIKIGNKVVIGAGSVVTKNIPDNCVAVGIPARIVKKLDSLLD